MENRKVRVRFAPSPTGPLHIGGVRTALYNYLFAKKNNGDFILRIEDTDQARFVPGAEEYIIESLRWCGILPNEGIGFGNGPFAPYRQSERKEIYRQYAEKLINNGNAYYAFDTADELEEARKKDDAFAYNSYTRIKMKNSLTLPEEEVRNRISAGENYVIRVKVTIDETIKLHDLIRGWVLVDTCQMDDKVLFKSDGMPTYHLANVVDDYLMKITHVIRGEEWLPSAPLHVLLYRLFGWEKEMPQFAHLPLLLKPDGNGKLSKRDGDRLGFPVFPLQWTDPFTNEVSAGYREKGYFPEAFVNMLALLGWNPGTEQEIFSLEELTRVFSFEHIHKAGAKFNPEKAKWFNQQYLKMKSDEEIALLFVEEVKWKMENGKLGLNENEISILNSHILQLSFIKNVCNLIKEKASFIAEFWDLSSYIFIPPTQYDPEVVKKRWNEKAKNFFEALVINLKTQSNFSKADIDTTVKSTAIQQNIKTGEIMQLLRVLITGRGSGADLMGIMELLGKDEVLKRLENSFKNGGVISFLVY